MSTVMLSTKVTVYLPSHDEDVIKKYVGRMVEVFGGCTIIPQCKGYWTEDILYIDDITLLTAFTNIPEVYAKNFAFIIAREIGVQCDQIYVSVELCGTLYFVGQEI